MKIILIICLAIATAFLVATCTKHKSGHFHPQRPYFISGIYTTWQHAPFNVTWDTILVSIDTSDHQLYRITRLSCFQQSFGDNYLVPQYINTRWTGTYDPTTGRLTALAGGENLLFLPTLDALQLDHILYNRIQ